MKKASNSTAHADARFILVPSKGLSARAGDRGR
ncbi:hypothetical protein MCEMSEM22_01208 [Comamonadaceae bacterium]